MYLIQVLTFFTRESRSEKNGRPFMIFERLSSITWWSSLYSFFHGTTDNLTVVTSYSMTWACYGQARACVLRDSSSRRNKYNAIKITCNTGREVDNEHQRTERGTPPFASGLLPPGQLVCKKCLSPHDIVFMSFSAFESYGQPRFSYQRNSNC